MKAVAPKPPPVPADVKGPPATAKKTASGLAYRILKPGTGTQQPMATDTVIAESNETVPLGVLAPDAIHTPGILIDHLIERPQLP